MIRTAFLLSLLVASSSALFKKAAPVKAAVPVKAVPVPARKFLSAPAKKTVAPPTPVKKVAAPAPKKVTPPPAPVKKVVAAAPVKKVVAAPVKKVVAAAPVKKVVAAPVKKVVAAPVKKVAAPAPKKVTPPPAPKRAPVAPKTTGGKTPAIFLTGYPGDKSISIGAPVSAFAGGLVGADVEAGEFDPWKLSSGVSTETLNWYRAAELKHARVAMLASLGILVASGIHLPDTVFESNGGLAGISKLYEERPAAIWQIITAIAAVEVSSLFKDGQGSAGDLGWDPLNFQAKYGLEDPEKFNIMQLKELKNGRLAMFASIALIFQEFISGQGVYEQFK